MSHATSCMFQRMRHTLMLLYVPSCHTSFYTFQTNNLVTWLNQTRSDVKLAEPQEEIRLKVFQWSAGNHYNSGQNRWTVLLYHWSHQLTNIPLRIECIWRNIAEGRSSGRGGLGSNSEKCQSPWKQSLTRASWCCWRQQDRLRTERSSIQR